MDKPTRQLSPRNERARRIRLTTFVGSLIAILIGAVSQTSPDDFRQLIPKPVEQAVSDTKDAVLDTQPGLWHVSRVVDGDTIDVIMGGQKDTVRLLGIDTPETHDPRKPVQCFGQAAADHTRSLLEGKNVRLEPDPTNSDRDKYNRLLRYIYLPDGTLINAQLIADGYAFAYTVFPLTKLDDFRTLEAQARDANRGLWAGCNIDDSKAIKQTTSAK